MLILTLLTFLVFTSYTGGALALAQDVTTSCTSALITPIFIYLTQSSNTTIEAMSSTASTTATESTPTTEAEHQTTTLTLHFVSPTTPTANPTKNTTVNDFGEQISLSTEQHDWVVGATVSLLCYDFLVMVAFAWCWFMGWFWWWRKVDRGDGQMDGERNVEWWGRRAVMDENMEREMRRLGMV